MKTDDEVLGLVDAFCNEMLSWRCVEAATMGWKRQSSAEDTETEFGSCSTKASFYQVHRPWEANVIPQSR